MRPDSPREAEWVWKAHEGSSTRVTTFQDPAGWAVKMFGLSQSDRSRVPYDPAALGLGLGSKFELTYLGLYQNVYGGVGVYSETRETNVL